MQMEMKKRAEVERKHSSLEKTEGQVTAKINGQSKLIRLLGEEGGVIKHLMSPPM